MYVILMLHIYIYVNYVPRKPVVQIEASKTVIGKSPPAPRVAYFSSRGPSSLTPDILKVSVSPKLISTTKNIYMKNSFK